MRLGPPLLARRTAVALLLAAATPLRAQPAPIRIGTLHFGSIGWELDVIRSRGLLPPGAVEEVDFATGPATQVALQAGRVDMIVQDWLWVARERAGGADWTLAPSSGAVGAVVAAAGSPVRTVADLPGRRLGIAGSPLDKSWLILRAYAAKTLNVDLDTAVTKSFAPPPLLAQQMAAGRLDAVLTYWPFAAKAEVAGQRQVLTIEDAVEALGVGGSVPFVGYVFSDRWAHEQATALAAFLRAADAARGILLTDDAEWTRLGPLTGAANQQELVALRDWYRRGVPRQRGAADREGAARLYQILYRVGGADLVGPSDTLPPGTFWTE